MADNSKDRSKKLIMEPSTVKAFVAGVIAGNLNKGLLLGFGLGVLGGIFVQQNIPGIPDLTNLWKDLIKRWNRTNGGSNSR